MTRKRLLVGLFCACNGVALTQGFQFLPPATLRRGGSAAQHHHQQQQQQQRQRQPIGREEWQGVATRRRGSGGSPLGMVDVNVASSVALAADQAVSAWSVTSSSSDIASSLFEGSLFPYLAFLFFLKKDATGAPKGAFFGFAFLLAFVGASIPAGVYAKLEYGEILANIDWLHGCAEALLTVTNILIVKAFRTAVVSPGAGTDGQQRDLVLESSGWATLLAGGLTLAMGAVDGGSSLLGFAMHAEPANALSFPTWLVHSSSLLEWLAAMVYVWRYAEVSGVKQWKGLTLAMIPLHTSGLCACTFHIFYNSPDVVALVALQAGLTVFGNSCLAFATYRIFQEGQRRQAQAYTAAAAGGGTAAAAAKRGGGKRAPPKAAAATEAAAEQQQQRLASGGQQMSDAAFYGRILAGTVGLAVVAKWGELFVDFPFEPTYGAALLLVLGPTVANALKWAARSKQDAPLPADEWI